MSSDEMPTLGARETWTVSVVQVYEIQQHAAGYVPIDNVLLKFADRRSGKNSRIGHSIYPVNDGTEQAH